MSFKVVSKLLNKFASTKIFKLFPSSVEIWLVSTSIKLLPNTEKELNVTWVPKTMLSLCQIVIKKMLLMLLLMLLSEPVDKDAWL